MDIIRRIIDARIESGFINTNNITYIYKKAENYINKNKKSKYVYGGRIMKAFKIIFVVLLIGIGIGAYFYFTPGSKAPQKEQVAVSQPQVAEQSVITAIRGKAKVMRSGNEINATIGMTLQKGDVIITMPKSEVDIQVAKQSVIKVKGNTKLELASLYDAVNKKTELKISKGKMLLGVRKLLKGESLQVRTPTAVAGVRGTSFVVNASSKKTKIAVVTGKVKVKTQKKEVVLNPLQETEAKSDGEVAPVKIITKATYRDAKDILRITNLDIVKERDKVKKELAKLKIVDVDNEGADELGIDIEGVDKRSTQDKLGKKNIKKVKIKKGNVKNTGNINIDSGEGTRLLGDE